MEHGPNLTTTTRAVSGRSPSGEYYVGFTVAGDELGLHPAREGQRAPGTGGQTAYWSVSEIDKAIAHFLEHGAKPHGQITDVGGGIRIGSVIDPFGNELGLIENPNSPNR